MPVVAAAAADRHCFALLVGPGWTAMCHGSIQSVFVNKLQRLSFKFKLGANFNIMSTNRETIIGKSQSVRQSSTTSPDVPRQLNTQPLSRIPVYVVCFLLCLYAGICYYYSQDH